LLVLSILVDFCVFMDLRQVASQLTQLACESGEAADRRRERST
jgi:hypothetical protein